MTAVTVEEHAGSEDGSPPVVRRVPRLRRRGLGDCRSRGRPEALVAFGALTTAWTGTRVRCLTPSLTVYIRNTDHRSGREHHRRRPRTGNPGFAGQPDRRG